MAKNPKINIYLQKLKDICTKHRKNIIASLCSLLVAILGIISFQIYSMYIFSLSIENRVEKIKDALVVSSFVDLAQFIDFNQIGLNMADLIILDSRSKFPEGSTPISISESVQKSLIGLLSAKEVEATEEKEGEVDEEVAAVISIFTPMNIFPNLALKQFISTFKILESDDNKALVEAVLKYERTNIEVKILLHMENTKSYGWRIIKILNPQQILDSYFEAKQILRNRVIRFVEERNNLTLSKMEKFFSLTSCFAAITTLSDKTTKILIIEVEGQNNGPHIIFNFNIITKYYNAKTEKLVDTFTLNLARRVFPYEKFSNVWNLQIDHDNPRHRILLDNSPLTCIAQFNNMSLSSGKVIYLNEIPAEQ